MSDISIYAITNAEGQSLDKWDINKKLEDLGIPEEVINQGETAIDNYALENGIDLSQLQVQLEKKEIKGADSKNKAEFEAKLEALGIPKEVIEKGKDAVMAYASENNIKLPPPPKVGSQFNLQS